MKALTFRQLRVFIEVSRHLSFARAAEALHLTPPAVSMQIKELESAVDLTLFDRAASKVSLTTAGEYFLVYARRLLACAKEAEDAMARLRHVEAGLLRVGLVSTAKYFIPHLLARFSQQHPGVEVRLNVTPNREQLLLLMASNEVDLSIMGRPPKSLSTRAEAFAAHPLVLIGPPNHPAIGGGCAPLSTLDADTFIVREHGSGTRHAMDAYFHEQRFRPSRTMEMSSNETIKQAVMAGLGVSFLSLQTIGLEVRSGLLSVLPIVATPVMRTWNIVCHSARVLSPAAEAFRYFMLEEGEEYLAAHDKPLLPAALHFSRRAPTVD